MAVSEVIIGSDQCVGAPSARATATATRMDERFARRCALALLLSVLTGFVSLSTAANAQPPAKIVRIGFLAAVPHAEREAAFRQELASLGYVEGRNLVIEYRTAEGRFERLPELAAELVRTNVDVIVAVVTQAAVAAKSATSTIPIVMIAVADPVAAKLVTSLARPGGNVTGNSSVTADLLGKQLELLREVLPRASRVAALWNPTNTVFQTLQLKEARAAASRLGIELQVVEATRPEALEGAFQAIAKARPDALLVMGDPMFTAQAERIARLALERRLPTVTGIFSDGGILLAYAPNFEDLHRRAAVYVDRILKGDRPADLPVERPTRFELIVSARTAKALGITIPPALVARADRVVQ
jgi:putative tryptophan/tyrosine transport system substrate-binding protein